MSQRQKIQLHNGCYIIPPVKELEVQPLMDQGLIQGARSVASNIGASFFPGIFGGLLPAQPQPPRHGSGATQAVLENCRCLVAVSDKDIEAASHTSAEQKEQLELLKEKKTVEEFYSSESFQILGREEDRAEVLIWIDPNLDDEWKRWLKHGIGEINKAAPGLNLLTSSKEKSKIHVFKGQDGEGCFTCGNIIHPWSNLKGVVEIYLETEWSNKERTATHEMLHALGFKHEHQRGDSDKSIKPSAKATNQVKANKHVIGISRFDPYSIMIYRERDGTYTRDDRDPVWKLKPDTDMNMRMSELDKVGLNLLYRPCEGPDYKPWISPKTGMLYCGRKVMEHHNMPASKLTSACGPDVSANCPACRTINTSRVKEIRDMGKWQGWSGMVYCKKYFGIQKIGHDGYCGPNNGPACEDCRKVLGV